MGKLHHALTGTGGLFLSPFSSLPSPSSFFVFAGCSTPLFVFFSTAIAVAVAAAIPGTIVSEAMLETTNTQQAEQKEVIDQGSSSNSSESECVTFERATVVGHTAGILPVQARVSKNTAAAADDSNWRADYAGFSRTARLLMDGRIYVPEELF